MPLSWRRWLETARYGATSTAMSPRNCGSSSSSAFGLTDGGSGTAAQRRPPHARRSFDTTIMPEPNSRVDFWCALTFEESRPPVAILDPQSDRDDRAQPVAVCSWCGRGHHGSAWLDIEELVHTAQLLERASMPAISYGICAGCRDEMAAAVLVLGGADESFAWPESYNSEDPTSTPASSERLFTSTCP